MAIDFKLAESARNAAADAVTALANSGYLRIYDGAKPSDPDDAIVGQVLLAELRFGSPAFGAAVAGVAVANAVTADSAANATGTASWYRALASDGVTKLWDGTVGLAESDLLVNDVGFIIGGLVTVTAITYTQPASC